LEIIIFLIILFQIKNFNEAIGSNTKIRLKDGSRIAGKSFSRKDSKINQINNASYTPCNRDNYLLKNCPGWKLSANKVIHDSEKQNIYYEGATLSILNIPFFIRLFLHTLIHTVKKRSGLLMPSISNDNVLGTSFSLPFFYNISSNYDLTFTPTIQTKVR
jgi:LPS-assembly protein